MYTFFELAKFVFPTVRILYYNKKIQGQEKIAEEFFLPGEQMHILKNRGFTILNNEKVYSLQAEMVIARK